MHFKFKYSFCDTSANMAETTFLNMFKTSFGAAKIALKCLFIHVLELGIFLPLFVSLT